MIEIGSSIGWRFPSVPQMASVAGIDTTVCRLDNVRSWRCVFSYHLGFLPGLFAIPGSHPHHLTGVKRSQFTGMSVMIEFLFCPTTFYLVIDIDGGSRLQQGCRRGEQPLGW